ncbi:hypothetical protein ACIRPQ_23920 [Streptomyces sp. NPDC101213]|uniref:hypothetical protein n=1 Tax=Streptomyces sp. NPDC101213 TaxID=3366130 RepID=UPI00381CBCDE
MTETLVTTGLGQRHTASLDIPLRSPTSETPFWHRDEPVLAVARLDPEYARLKEHFPHGWERLVQTKSLFDGIAALDVPQIEPSSGQREQTVSLVRAAAQELLAFADEETAPGTQDAVLQARTAAQRLNAYARTGAWEPITLQEPHPDRPWLYCGPIGTWAMRAAEQSIGFLVAVPSNDLQQEVDMVTLRTSRVRDRVAEVLGSEIKSIQDMQPSMCVLDLLLSGGESAVGHKNFAHFFPLEAPQSRVNGPEFTVVFANIHRERIQNCSLRLFKKIQGADAQTRLDGLLRTSLRWFRGHDLVHFWRKSTVPDEGRPAEGLTPFECMALEETYADVLGLLSAGLFSSDLHLGEAYRAELFRYLSRRRHHFADTAAAVLTAGWLQTHQVSLEPDTSKNWLPGARQALEELARTLHSTLWEEDASQVAVLRSALATGADYQKSLGSVFRSLPTDLSYTFG